MHDVVIGSGVEHMGHIPMGVGFKWVDEVGSPWPQELLDRYNLIPQGLSAEMIADQWEIPRSELDELAVRSHELAHRATEEGRFERETIPFAVNGDTYVTDQGIRPGHGRWRRCRSSSRPSRRTARSPPATPRRSPTARRRCCSCRARRPTSWAASPRARIADQTTVGVDPVIMLTGPIPATRSCWSATG